MIPQHPEPEQLLAFIDGRMSEPDAETIQTHLIQCATCVDTLDHIPSKSALEQCIRSAQKSYEELDATAQTFFDDMKRASPEGLADEREVLGILEPSEVAGDLGLLGRYRILSKVGAGGMGSVFKAVHPVMDREVALKVISSRLLASREAVARFQREVRAVARLHHSNIVEAYDADSAGDVQFLVMEFVDGLDLARQVRRDGPLPADRAADYVRQAALALQHAFEKGMIHRDVKPANLMLTPDGRIKLLDLGLARICQEVSDQQTSADILLGTPDFMAPEQGNDSHDVDIRADIYSLGCTLYFLLTGRVPFPEGRTVQKLVAHQTRQPQSLLQLRPELPPQLVAVVNRMMAKNPNERFATPAEVAEALSQFVRSEKCGPISPKSAVPQVVGTRVDIGEDHSSLPHETRGIDIPRSPEADFGEVRPHSRRVARIAAVGATILLCGVVFVLNTARGTVEVHVMEPDVQVTVEDQTVNVDSRLVGRVSLAVGNHTLIVRRGDEELYTERFELRRSGHKVIEARWVKAVPPTSTTGKTEKVTAPYELENGTPSISTKANSPADREKPFAVLSVDGKSRGEFKHLADALAAIQKDDTIEIHGNGPYRVGQVALSGRDLIVRAAVGFRPVILPASTVRPGEWWFTVIEGEVSIEGCEFQGGSGTGMLWGAGANWQIRNCRFVGQFADFLNFYGKKLRFENCLISIHGALGLVGRGSELELVNNLICFEGGIGLHAPGGQVVRLQHNTFVRSVAHHTPLIGFHGTITPPERPLQVEAVGNIIHVVGRVVTQLPEYADWLDQLQWRGRDNLYLEPSLIVGTRDGQEIVKDLDGWNSKWGKEEGSRSVPSVRFEWDQVFTQPTEAAIQTLRRIVDGVREQNRNVTPDLGPNWDLVGPGDACVRVLASQRQPLPEKLPAKIPPGGQFAVWRNARLDQSHPKFQDAIDAAADGDVLEIYTSDELVSATFPANKRLHLRAAPGYRPGVEGPLGNVSSVEGLCFRKPLLTMGTNRFVNCSFDEGLSIEFGADQVATKEPIEIINCWIADRFVFDPPPGRKVIVRNSVVGRLVLKGDGQHECPVELDRCVVWNPGPGIPILNIPCPAFVNVCAKKVHVSASRTLVESGGMLFLDYDFGAGGSLRWRGTQNVYRIGRAWANVGSGMMVPFDLDGWRRFQKSDELDSVEADPLIYDPLQWRLLPSSTGHLAGSNGRDLGADVDHVAK